MAGLPAIEDMMAGSVSKLAKLIIFITKSKTTKVNGRHVSLYHNTPIAPSLALYHSASVSHGEKIVSKNRSVPPDDKT